MFLLTNTRYWRSQILVCHDLGSTLTRSGRKYHCDGCHWRPCVTISTPVKVTYGRLLLCCGRLAHWVSNWIHKTQSADSIAWDIS
jgi:hypothetical protein